MPQVSSSPKPLHIFKPGQWTTAAGEVIEFSQADLEATAKAYDPKKGKAPLVIGHPKIDDPAMGWAAQLTVNERGLFATPIKVDPAFAESVRDGRYEKISAKFYRPTDANNPVPGVWYLRHIGFLGAHPPGVKGLDDPEFSEADDGCVCFREGVEFGEWDAMTTANILRSIREWIVSKFGLEEADRVIPNYDVRALELGAAEDINAAREAASLPAAFAEDNTQVSPPQESNVTEEEAARLRAENEANKRQLQELRDAEARRIAQAVHAENVAFAESMATDARIPAAATAQVAAIGTQLQTVADVEFGEGDQKKPLHQVFREFIQALPRQVEFGEQATRDRAASGIHGDSGTETPVEFAEGADPDRVAQDKRIRAYAATNKVDYATAAHAVMRSK
ncbi:peptidase [Acidovorax sp. DW039]|uniref:peptidase n=1 Tax=Acidovorax sp. DW039 TaxID=3095606 RepID=UPI00308DB343|nr:peptidase [Acidovorax sp. DW039]